ncbi:MAG: N-formylglutamate amidohydrolase [Deltaproteobacteria bacterium]|nr:N-formylglutamate amidohydrolase [Deltaproteobacteria bacterium]
MIEIPHAGLLIPPGTIDEPPPSHQERLSDSDAYVDRIFIEGLESGASVLVAHFSRYVVDLNRAEDDVDPQLVPEHPRPKPSSARGVIWKATTRGRPLFNPPLPYSSFEARIARFHRPYHAMLDAEVERKRKRFGWVVVLSGHSMPSSPWPGGPRNADVVPGCLGGKTASLWVRQKVERGFRRAGLSVCWDEPYRGGHTTKRLGKPEEGIHAVQIEINRALYMDERLGAPIHPRIECLGRIIKEMVSMFGETD